MFAGVAMKGKDLTKWDARYNVVGGTDGLGGFRSDGGEVLLGGVDLWEPLGMLAQGGEVGFGRGDPPFALGALPLGVTSRSAVDG